MKQKQQLHQYSKLTRIAAFNSPYPSMIYGTIQHSLYTWLCASLIVVLIGPFCLLWILYYIYDNNERRYPPSLKSCNSLPLFPLLFFIPTVPFATTETM